MLGYIAVILKMLDSRINLPNTFIQSFISGMHHYP